MPSVLSGCNHADFPGEQKSSGNGTDMELFAESFPVMTGTAQFVCPDHGVPGELPRCRWLSESAAIPDI